MLFASIVAAFFYAAAPVRAAPSARSARLSLAPSVVMLHAHFGQSMTQSIALDNQTGQGFAFDLQADDVVVRDHRRVYVPAGKTPNSIAATAMFLQRSGYVAPNSQQTITVRLTIPQRTNVRAVVIYFRSKRIIADHGLVSLNASLGALITFVLTQNIAVAAGPVHSAPPTASRNLRVEEELTNTGSEPIVPTGVAAIVTPSGALVAKVPFTQQRLLPGERLSFPAEYGGRLPPGSYRVLCSFEFEGRTLTTSGALRVR